MKRLRFRIEDKARIFINYLDYYFFKLTHLPKQPPEIKKIIVIELKYIGDIIVSTPVYTALKQRFPNAKIDVAVPKGMEDILFGNKNINKIVTMDKEKPALDETYDLGIILHNGTKKISKLLKQKAKFRIGCTRVGISEPKGYYLHRKTKPSKWQHKVFDNLDVLKTIGINVINPKLELFVNPKARKSVQAKLTKKGIKTKDKILIIHTPPQHKTHQWLPERFAELSDILSKNYKVVFTGSEKDLSLVNNIFYKMHNKAINMVGVTTISEFIALTERADLMISVDTGAMHVAAALKKPVIALFGAGDPKIWHPFSENSKVIYKNEVCTSCMKHHCTHKAHMECMKAITVKDILEAIHHYP